MDKRLPPAAATSSYGIPRPERNSVRKERLRQSCDPVIRVAFSHDGLTVAAGNQDGTVRLWSGFLWRNFVSLRSCPRAHRPRSLSTGSARARPTGANDVPQEKPASRASRGETAKSGAGRIGRLHLASSNCEEQDRERRHGSGSLTRFRGLTLGLPGLCRQSQSLRPGLAFLQRRFPIGVLPEPTVKR